MGGNHISAPLYPVALRLAGRRCLVVGAGEVALRKIEGLVAAGAVVRVVAPRVEARVSALPGVTVERRPYRRGEVAGHHLVFAATEDPAVNAAVHEDAEEAGIWVNAADDPERCSFLLPAVARSGPVMLAVSTAGASPVLAQWVRDRCAEQLEGVAAAAEHLAAARGAVRAAGRSTEGLPWPGLVGGLVADARAGDDAGAAGRVGSWLAEVGVRR